MYTIGQWLASSFHRSKLRVQFSHMTTTVTLYQFRQNFVTACQCHCEVMVNKLNISTDQYYEILVQINMTK